MRNESQPGCSRGEGYAACRSHDSADHNQLCDTNELGKKGLEASFGFDIHHMNSRNDETKKHPSIACPQKAERDLRTLTFLNLHCAHPSLLLLCGRRGLIVWPSFIIPRALANGG